MIHFHDPQSIRRNIRCEMTFGWGGIVHTWRMFRSVRMKAVWVCDINELEGEECSYSRSGQRVWEDAEVRVSSFQFCWRLKLISKMDNLKSMLVSLPLMTGNCRREQSEDTRCVIKLARQCVFLTEFPNRSRRSNETMMMYRCQMGVFPCPL